MPARCLPYLAYIAIRPYNISTIWNLCTRDAVHCRSYLFVVGYAFIAGCRSLTEYDLGFAAALAVIAGHAMTEVWRWSGQGPTRGWSCHQLPTMMLVMRG